MGLNRLLPGTLSVILYLGLVAMLFRLWMVAGPSHEQTLRERLESQFAVVTVVLASCAALASYVLLYARNADVQPWYSGNLLAPAAVLLASAAQLIAWRLSTALATPLFALATLALITLNAQASLPIHGDGGYWPHQRDLHRAATYLRESQTVGPNWRLERRRSALLRRPQRHPQPGRAGEQRDSSLRSDRHLAAVPESAVDPLHSRLSGHVRALPRCASAEATTTQAGWRDSKRSSSSHPESSLPWSGLTLYQLDATSLSPAD